MGTGSRDLECMSKSLVMHKFPLGRKVVGETPDDARKISLTFSYSSG